MERVAKKEIEGAVEMMVNSYMAQPDTMAGDDFQTWEDGVYMEIVMNKSHHIGNAVVSIQSNENRFEGGEQIRKRIRPILRARLKELKAKGHDIKAI